MSRKQLNTSAATPSSLPHSWSLADWDREAPGVWPNRTARARYLYRAHKRDLLAEGAVVRVGRNIVFIGSQYAKFLARKATDIPGYQSPTNRSNAEATAG